MGHMIGIEQSELKGKIFQIESFDELSPSVGFFLKQFMEYICIPLIFVQ